MCDFTCVKNVVIYLKQSVQSHSLLDIFAVYTFKVSRYTIKILAGHSKHYTNKITHRAINIWTRKKFSPFCFLKNQIFVFLHTVFIFSI